MEVWTLIMFETRKYLILPVSEESKIDWNLVLGTELTRKNADGTKSFIKWEGDTPSFVSNLTGTAGPYTHSEILEILNGSDWSTEQDVIDDMNNSVVNVENDEDDEDE